MTQTYYHFELDIRGLTAQQAEALLDAFRAVAEVVVPDEQVAAVVVPMDDDNPMSPGLSVREAQMAERERIMEEDRQREEHWYDHPDMIEGDWTAKEEGDNVQKDS